MDIVKENENFRAYIVHDESADKPYDEGATPILSREFGRYGGFSAVNDQASGYVDMVNEAWNRLNRDDDVLARFLRIFYGSKSVLWDSSSNYAYLAFDTAAWRETVGLTDEYMSTVGADVLDPETLAEGSLNEVMAWANGEVYGYIVERRMIAYTTLTDPVTGDQASTRTGSTWEEIDSCYGFYGYDYAAAEAKDVFEAHTAR